MSNEAIKLELMEWLSKLEDEDTIAYLKIVKEASAVDKDWWTGLSLEQKKGIERGVRDIEAGRIVAHEDVKRKYGL